MDVKVKTIEIEDGVNGYVDLVQHVLKDGEHVAPRGMDTREIEEATIYISDVRRALT